MTKTLILLSWWAMTFAMDASDQLSIDKTAEPADELFVSTSSEVAVDVADLKQQLVSELEARLPAEFAFIDLVIQRVDNNTLPRSLVEGTFLWARRQKPYPFQHFEEGLRRRAAELGIQL